MDAIDELRDKLPKFCKEFPLWEEAIVSREEASTQFPLQCYLLHLADHQEVALTASALGLHDGNNEGVLDEDGKGVLS